MPKGTYLCKLDWFKMEAVAHHVTAQGQSEERRPTPYVVLQNKTEREKKKSIKKSQASINTFLYFCITSPVALNLTLLHTPTADIVN